MALAATWRFPSLVRSERLRCVWLTSGRAVECQRLSDHLVTTLEIERKEDLNMSACMRFTQRVWRSFVENKGHDFQCFPNLKILKAKPGLLEASLKIEPYNLNRVGTVHGGLIMSLTDTMGSLAVATKGQYMTGVSVDVGTSFVKPGGRVGDQLTVKAEVTGIGKSLAYTRVDFYNAQGQLAAYGHHTKYIGKSAGHKSDVKFSEDGERVIEGEDVD